MCEYFFFIIIKKKYEAYEIKYYFSIENNTIQYIPYRFLKSTVHKCNFEFFIL